MLYLLFLFPLSGNIKLFTGAYSLYIGCKEQSAEVYISVREYGCRLRPVRKPPAYVTNTGSFVGGFCIVCVGVGCVCASRSIYCVAAGFSL